MTKIVKVQSVAHVALLDAINSAGIVVTPPTRGNVWLGTSSVHGIEWDVVVTELVAGGWTFLADDYDLPVVLMTLDDGSRVYGLYPILEEGWEALPTVQENREFDLAVLALVDHFAEGN